MFNLANIENIWFCGIPGSRLSAVSNNMVNHIEGISGADRSGDRSFKHHTPQGTKSEDGSGHDGIYWGQTNMTTHWEVLKDEHPDFFRRDMEDLYPIEKETRLMKSHIWARHNNLDYIWQNFPGDLIFLVYRNVEESFRWWHNVMKFEDGYYPDYRLIYNENEFKEQLYRENAEMQDFVIRKGAKWQPYTDKNMNLYFNTSHKIKLWKQSLSFSVIECGKVYE
tara:strand:+ start:223 stop:891 length:669 start_codon:yes stop_codon:yes gene_type:complete